MSLRFPLVFWNDPPSLSFTACIITKSKERIVTGTHGGLCVLWCLEKRVIKTNNQAKQLTSTSSSISSPVSPLSQKSNKQANDVNHASTANLNHALFHNHNNNDKHTSDNFTMNTSDITNSNINSDNSRINNSNVRHFNGIPIENSIARTKDIQINDISSEKNDYDDHNNKYNNQKNNNNDDDHHSYDVGDGLDLLEENVEYIAEPFAVLYGHESVVTDLAECVYDLASSVCSVSLDGSLCVWNLSDGRCMAFSPFVLSGSPTSVVALPGGSLVACSGKYNNIEIVDLRLLKVVTVLEGHQEWVTSLSCGPIAQNNDFITILLSASEDKTLKYWMFEKMDGDRMEWDQFSAYSVNSQTNRPLSVRHSDDWSWIMIVSEKLWYLFTYQAVEPVLVMEAPKGETLKGGLFIDNLHVLIYTIDGDGYVYELPKQESNTEFQQVTKEAENMKNRSLMSSGKKKRVQRQKSFQPVSSDPENERSLSETQQRSDPNLSPLAIFGNQFLSIFKKKQDTSPIKNPNNSSSVSKLEKTSSDRYHIKKSYSMPMGFIEETDSMGNSNKETKTNTISSEKIGQSSLEAAMNKALNTDITSKETSTVKTEKKSSKSSLSKESPILIDVLREEAHIKQSLGTSVWRTSDGFVVRADTSGNLKIWKLNLTKERRRRRSSFCGERNIVHYGERGVIQIQEVTTSALASGWPNIVKFHNSMITASQFALDTKDKTSKLIHGFDDGQITITPIISNENPIIIPNAHKLSVTALLVMNDDGNEKTLLISGSADYSLKIWDLSNGHLLKTFFLHSGSVNLIFLPPRLIRKKLHNCFCSVGEDRSVILYSLKTMECLHILGGHSSSVVAVYWRVDLDYLLVRCSDGSVYVWQINTGLLERRVFGKAAAELIERSEGPGSSKRPTCRISFSKQSAFVEQSRGFLESLSISVSDTEPDVQLLMLSGRRLIAYVNNKRDMIRESLICKKQLPDTVPHSLISALSYIFQYGKNASLDKLKSELMIMDAKPSPYIGLKGAGSTFSLIVPKASDRCHPFLFSPILSALNAICTIATLNSLSAIPELKILCQEVSNYYLNEMPKEFERYEDPSFLWSAQFLKDSSKEIQNAAKSVMSAVLKRMDKKQLKGLAEKLTSDFMNTQDEQTISPIKQTLVVALAVLAYKEPEIVDNRIKSVIAKGLIEILELGGPQHTTAISLLGDGFSTWEYYIPDTASFCRQLFQLSLPALTSNMSPSVDSIAPDALQSFINMSCADPQLYVEFINGVIINSQQTSTTTLSAAITSIYPLIHKHPTCLMDHLVVITSLLLKVLDPHFPQIRDSCMPISTSVLRHLVETYPMISFHQEKQKLAVGNNDGIIVIYDMRSATKWQVFESHKSPISAVAFSPNGEVIATFSASEGYCKLWSIDGSGILNLLGVASRCIKSFEIPYAKQPHTKKHDILKSIKIVWHSNKKFLLHPGKDLPDFSPDSF